MADATSTEIQYTDQQEASVYDKMASNVAQFTGQPTSPQSLKPEDNAALGEIKEIVGDAVHIVGSTIEGSETADIRTTPGKGPLQIVREKILRFRSEKAA